MPSHYLLCSLPIELKILRILLKRMRYVTNVLASNYFTSVFNQDENTRIIRELREEIARLREQMGSGQFAMGQAPVTNLEQVNKMEVCKMMVYSCVVAFVTNTQKMIQDLELAKKETWEEKERLSAKYVDERTKNLASKVSACAREHKLIGASLSEPHTGR